jgi:hypothetical protein
MSIFRNTFTTEVSSSLNNRQKALQKRSANDIIYLNSRNSWVRMTSGVNVGGTNDLAKDYVMLGGVLNSRADKSLRSGVGTSDKSYSTSSPSTNSYNTSATAGTAGLKPMPGITSVDVKSKSAYGSLREVTVNFSCNNIQQLEDLELLYMRPGYTVLVEWGFSPYLDKGGNIQNNFEFYDKVLEGTATIDQIFKDLFERSRKYEGNYEGHYGYVKNYNWSVRADGGYDCQTTILSVGELMESLVTSWTPMNVAELAKNGLVAPTTTTNLPFLNPNNVTNPFQFTSVSFQGGSKDKDKEEESKRGQNYSKSILTGTLYELYRYCFDKIGTLKYFAGKPKPVGQTDYDLFAFKTTTPTTPDSIIDGGVQAYITLESFVKLLNKHVVTATANKQYQNIQPFTELSVYPNTYDPANTTGSLLCLAHPLQVSVDPSICLITSPIWAGGVTFTNLSNDKEKSTRSLPEIPVLKELKRSGKDFRYQGNYGNELGNIGNIYLNINRLHQLSTDSRLINSDQELKLYDFLKTILKEVQSSIGSVNTFDIHIDPIDSVARIIDFNYVDEKSRTLSTKEAFQIEVANLNSTVRSYSLQSQIFPNQSNLIALGAQLDGAGNQSSQNATLIDFNRDVEDRIVPKKLPSVSGKYTNVTGGNDLETVKANVSISIEKIGQLLVPNASANPSTTTVNPGDDSSTSSYDYKTSLSNLIRYFQGITNSTTKNRGIIPVKISLTMDGIGGLIIGHLFKIPADLLPRGYKFSDGSSSKLLQIITGISHKIAGGDWTTTIDALNIIATEPTDETKFKDLLTITDNKVTINLSEASKSTILNTPWSAAFISYVATSAGFSFPNNASHTGYAQSLRSNNNGFEILNPAITKIQVGDIVIQNRGNSMTFSTNPWSGNSHGDIITKISGNSAEGIGGNVSNTVYKSSFSLNNGKLPSNFFVILRPFSQFVATVKPQDLVNVALTEYKIWNDNKWKETDDAAYSTISKYYDAVGIQI